jgi:cbb3-type cytochrome oxidase maturation protein
MLISISIVVAVFFLYAFIKAVRGGQYDDDYTPSVRMLFDDELLKEIPKKENKNPKTVTLSAPEVSGEGTILKEKENQNQYKTKII